MTASSNGSRYARFIPSEEMGQQRVAQWHFGSVDETVRAAEHEAARVQALQEEADSPAVQEKLQQMRDAAHAEGYATGHADATREANARLDDYVNGQGRTAAEQLASAVAAAQQGLEASQQRIADSVLEIACALARQVLRRELAADPHALQPVIREALGILSADGRPSVVRLHPHDLELLRAPLHEEFAGVPATWLGDATLAPGDCLVESAGTVIDGRLEARWKGAVAALGLDVPWETPAAHDLPPAADAPAAAAAEPHDAD